MDEQVKQPGVSQTAQSVLEPLQALIPDLESLYRDLHAHPELSLQETRTAAEAARQLREAGCEVTEGIGGTGVAGVIENGPGPVVMLRADMDALPVEERTGLPYASQATGRNGKGETVPVMHACGHDAHVTCLVGTARLMARSRNAWKGTLLLVVQPAEEIFEGANAMVEDGLFTRFPRPEVILGQHVLPFPAGMVGHRAGPTMAAAVTLGVTVHGKGGHGSMPHSTVDPVVIAAHIVTRLQTIVSREMNPSDRTVVTVGSLHAGTQGNVIPDQAYMEVNVRSFDDAVHAHIVDSIKRIVRAEAEAGRAPREPEFTVLTETIVTDNDEDSVARVRAAHQVSFGEDRVFEMPMLTGSEDFPEFGRSGEGRFPGPDIPYAYWGVGTVDAGTWSRAEGRTLEQKIASLPVNHSPFFAPAPRETLQTGVQALTSAALAYLGS